jgi:hypothetical protein
MVYGIEPKRMQNMKHDESLVGMMGDRPGAVPGC